MMSSENVISPTNLIPFRILNRKNFLHQDHPKNFTLEDEYYRYWDRQALRCIEGYWGEDKDNKGNGGYRFMPPNLYFYINLTKIQVEGDEGAQPMEHPQLRDVDWYIFYALMACDGFSGFAKDDEYTSLRAVGKLQRGEKLTVADEHKLKQYENQIKKPNGEYKTYVEAREYLYKTHSKKLGRALYANECLNIILLSTRGLGKSYSVANGIIAYDYIFGRNRTLYDWKVRNSTATLLVGAAVEKKSLELLDKAVTTISTFEYGLGYCENKSIWDGKGEKGLSSGFFHRPQIGTPKTGEIYDNVPDAGKKSREENTNKIVHVTYGNGKGSAGAGFRAKCIIEEAGLLYNFKQVHNENNGTQNRETKTFYSIYIGTGGDIEKIKEIQEAFYNPSEYTMLEYDNIYDKKSDKIGMFIPAYYVKLRNKDDNGNTIMELAIRDVLEERQEKMLNGKNGVGNDSYEGHVRSYPIEPKEMFRASSGGRYGQYVSQFERRINQLDSGEWKKNISIGMLSNVDNGQVKWKEDVERKMRPIIRYGDENGKAFADDKRSAILIYEHPVKHKPKIGEGNPLYMVFYDPVKYDGKGTSIASITVWKGYDPIQPSGMQDNIVAEYHGRFPDNDDVHDIAVRLAYYYGTSVLYENNLPEFAKYVKNKYPNDWYLLLENEPILMEKGKVRGNKKTGKKGVYMEGFKIPRCETYLENWLNTKINVTQKVVNNELVSDEEYPIDKIMSYRILDELILYEREFKTEFDALSSMLLMALWRECYKENPFEIVDNKTDTKTYENIKKAYEINKKLTAMKKDVVGFDW